MRIPSAELSELMTARAAHHEAQAALYQRELLRPESERSARDAPSYMLAHDRDSHHERAMVLRFLRDRLIPGETYVLAEYDLRMADLLGDEEVGLMPIRRDGGEQLQLQAEAFGSGG